MPAYRPGASMAGGPGSVHRPGASRIGPLDGLAFGGGAGNPNIIGGWTIGTPGAAGTLYQTYTLAGGDDFATLNIVGPRAPAGKWFPTGAYHAATIRNNTTSLGFSWDADPLTSGYNDTNRGVAIGLNTMRLIAPSILRLQARQATAPEQAFFSPTDVSINGGVRPQISAMMHSAGCFAYFNTNVPVLVSLRMRLSSKTTNPGGSHMSAWDYCATPPTSTVGNERDIECSSQGLYHENIPHGTPGSNLSNGAFDFLDGQFHIFDYIFVNGSSAKLYVDGILKSSLVTDVQTAGTPNHFILSNHIVNGFNGDAYSGAAWAASAVGASMDIDWIRFAYDTAAGRNWVPLATLPDVNVAYNGVTNIVLPNELTLFGDATATLNVQVMPYDVMEPGLTISTAFTQFPPGWTYDAPSRTISIDYSAVSGNAGCSHVVVYGFKTDTAFVAQPIRFVVNRGPNITATTIEPIPDGAGGLVADLYYAADCGYVFNASGPPKTMSMSGLPVGWTFNPTTFLLTSPTSVVAGATVSLTVTNGAGQQTTGNLELWSPAMTGSVFTWDSTAPTSIVNDGSGNAQFVRDIYDATKQLAQSTLGRRPLISVTGGVGNNKRVLSYIGNNIELNSQDGASTGMAPLFTALNTSDVRTTNLYTCFAGKVTTTGVVNRFLGLFKLDGTQFYAFRNGTTTRGASIQAAGGAAQNADQTAQDTVMHVIEIVKTGAAVVVRLDGTQIATVTITQTGAMALDTMILGGAASAGSVTGAFIGQLGPGLITSTLPNTADQLRARQWVGNKMGVTVV